MEKFWDVMEKFWDVMEKSHFFMDNSKFSMSCYENWQVLGMTQVKMT